MRSRRGKARVERRVLADGTVKEYRYGPRAKALPRLRTVSKMLGDWQESAEFRLLGANTAKAYVRYSKPLHDTLGPAEIDKIKRRNLLAIRDVIASQRGQGAALQFCKVAAVFFRWLAEREYIAFSPAVDLKKALERGVWTAWTLEQALKAEAELPPHYARVIFLARHTGQRRGDLCAMRWEDYKNNSIHVIQQKTGAELNIPATQALRVALEQWRSTSKGETILQQPDGSPINPDSLSVRLPVELKRIGLPEGLNIHGLRKLCAASLADAGCTPHEIMAITGHKTLGMVAHYTRSADQRNLSASAVERLDVLQNITKRPKNTKESYD